MLSIRIGTFGIAAPDPRRGRPLASRRAVVNLIAGATKRTGPIVRAAPDTQRYDTALKVIDDELACRLMIVCTATRTTQSCRAVEFVQVILERGLGSPQKIEGTSPSARENLAAGRLCGSRECF